MKSKSGFTLIELIIVISIIGVLMTLGLGSYVFTQKRARDAKRETDMKEIMYALTRYYVDHGQYPPSPPSYGEANCSGWDTSNTDGDSDGITFLDPLVEAGYLDKSYRDPLDDRNNSCGGHGNDGYNYFYYRYTPGQYGCPTARGNYIVLGFGTAESSSGPHPNSQGLVCSGRDWHDTIDYVLHRFEK